jgi:hypothetical protein
MSDSEYSPPMIEARDPIGLPLIGAPAISTPPAQSAAFRPEMAETYVAPRIIERTTVGGPLVAFGSAPPPPP